MKKDSGKTISFTFQFIPLRRKRIRVPANKLSANGYGEFQPINLGDAIEDLKQNRRIELKITQN